MGCWGRKAGDQTDYPPIPMLPSIWDIFCLWWAIFFHLFDLATDVNVALHYYHKGELYFVIATIVIVVVPSIIVTCVSCTMYSSDKEGELSYKCNQKEKLRILMLVFQLAPVLRYYDSVRYAYKTRKAERQNNKQDQEKYYKLMLKEDADVALLRIFESFLESAPQQVLQMSYLLKAYYERKPVESGFTGYDPVISAISSFAGMAFCLLTYQKSIRYVQENKDNINWKGSIFIFMWHLFVSISRILMLSAMLYISWKYTLYFILVHWVVMTVSLSILESHQFCTKPSSIEFEKVGVCETVGNILFSSVLGLVYIFTYITPGEGGTCFRYTSFYVICLIENIIGAVIWYHYMSTSWFSILMTIMCVLPFTVGCLCMTIYHLKFHPKGGKFPRLRPEKRQNQMPESLHLTATPSPKIGADQSTEENGAVPRIASQGDEATRANLVESESCVEKL